MFRVIVALPEAAPLFRHLSSLSSVPVLTTSGTERAQCDGLPSTRRGRRGATSLRPTPTSIGAPRNAAIHPSGCVPSSLAAALRIRRNVRPSSSGTLPSVPRPLEATEARLRRASSGRQTGAPGTISQLSLSVVWKAPALRSAQPADGDRNAYNVLLRGSGEPS